MTRLPTPDHEVTRAFRRRFSDLAASEAEPLYALPLPLLSAIERELPGLLTEFELDFEREFASLCNGRGAVGTADEIFIQHSILNPPGLPSITPKDWKAMGGGAETDERSIETSRQAARERLEPVTDQRQAYLGWLLTNLDFLSGRNAVRSRRDNALGSMSFRRLPWQSRDEHFEQFLNHWMLCDMSSWELPIPQGPNLTGQAWPEQFFESKPAVHVTLPVTTALPTRYPLGQILKEARRLQTPAHLQGWLDVLEPRGKSKGVMQFRHVFGLHFYRDLALGGRYGDRLPGHNQALDRALGKFLHLSEDAIKKLRLTIAKRLKPAAPLK